MRDFAVDGTFTFQWNVLELAFEDPLALFDFWGEGVNATSVRPDWLSLGLMTSSREVTDSIPEAFDLPALLSLQVAAGIRRVDHHGIGVRGVQ